MGDLCGALDEDKAENERGAHVDESEELSAHGAHAFRGFFRVMNRRRKVVALHPVAGRNLRRIAFDVGAPKFGLARAVHPIVEQGHVIAESSAHRVRNVGF